MNVIQCLEIAGTAPRDVKRLKLSYVLAMTPITVCAMILVITASRLSSNRWPGNGGICGDPAGSLPIYVEVQRSLRQFLSGTLEAGLLVTIFSLAVGYFLPLLDAIEGLRRRCRPNAGPAFPPMNLADHRLWKGVVQITVVSSLLAGTAIAVLGHFTLRSMTSTSAVTEVGIIPDATDGLNAGIVAYRPTWSLDAAYGVCFYRSKFTSNTRTTWVPVKVLQRVFEIYYVCVVFLVLSRRMPQMQCGKVVVVGV